MELAHDVKLILLEEQRVASDKHVDSFDTKAFFGEFPHINLHVGNLNITSFKTKHKYYVWQIEVANDPSLAM